MKGELKIDYDKGTLEFISDDEEFIAKVIGLGKLKKSMCGIVVQHMVGIATVTGESND